MKKYYLVISFFLIFISGNSQSFKGVFSLGLSVNQIDGDLQGGYYHVGRFCYSGVEIKVYDD